MQLLFCDECHSAKRIVAVPSPRQSPHRAVSAQLCARRTGTFGSSLDFGRTSPNSSSCLAGGPLRIVELSDPWKLGYTSVPCRESWYDSDVRPVSLGCRSCQCQDQDLLVDHPKCLSVKEDRTAPRSTICNPPLRDRWVRWRYDG